MDSRLVARYIYTGPGECRRLIGHWHGQTWVPCAWEWRPLERTRLGELGAYAPIPGTIPEVKRG